MLDVNVRIEGKKTLIRPFNADDISDVYLSWLNDRDLMKFSNQRFIHHDEKNSSIYLQSFAGTSNGFFAVEDSCSGSLIGTMTVYFFERQRIADVGVLIGNKGVAGKGFGTDCWCAMIEWLKCQEVVRKITAGTVSINKPMLSLMRAADMQEDGRRREQDLIGNAPVDVVYYALFP